MGKTLTAKTPPGDFQVTTPETPLLSNQAVTSKGIPSTLPTYSWTLTPIPNWTWSVVTISTFDARLPSTWLTNALIPVRDFKHQLRRRGWLQNSSVHPIRWRSGKCLVTKPYGANTQQLLERIWTRLRTLSFDHNLLKQRLLNAFATCVQFDGSWKNPFICLGLEEKKAQKHIHGSQGNQIRKTDFVILDR